jgi:hypothetical protein
MRADWLSATRCLLDLAGSMVAPGRLHLLEVMAI